MPSTTQTTVQSIDSIDSIPTTIKRRQNDKTKTPKTKPVSKIPICPKNSSIPRLDQPSQHKFILLQSLLPITVHQLTTLVLSISRYDDYVHPFLLRLCVIIGYGYAFRFLLRREGLAIRTLGKKLGYLDGDHHPRDKVPRDSTRLNWSLPLTVGSRTVMCVLVAYDPSQQPINYLASLKWWAWLAVYLSLYPIILDFYYYCVHRAWHEVPCLWRFHRRHHTIKRPSILFTAYADSEQELFDIVGTPLLTFFTLKALHLPMDFYTWWICIQYIAYTEVMGHSGLRIYTTPPISCSWLLQRFGVELVIEDHDLHHRQGYRQARNYGKQTRIWDRLFGTCADRIETNPVNIQKGRRVMMHSINIPSLGN
uniref:Fatty acid hydroxylase vlmA n=1 Tax=Lecanicillium sp. TaxID=1756136 RepID=VLMA_LECSP|nr:RecName: Full=Fatty acid hydroxylase vlmA; AltName: Full=Verlamelin biosynthesis protein A [Lecanicillium sp.]BAO73253.1 putative fatty acid hydroxylase [Lecanicillium sp. HF627]